jgi:hypothetical protein
MTEKITIILIDLIQITIFTISICGIITAFTSNTITGIITFLSPNLALITGSLQILGFNLSEAITHLLEL